MLPQAQDYFALPTSGTLAVASTTALLVSVYYIARFTRSDPLPEGAMRYRVFSKAPSFHVHCGHAEATDGSKRRFEVRALAPTRPRLGQLDATKLDKRDESLAMLNHEAAELVNAEWPGSGASIERGVALSQRSITLVLGLMFDDTTSIDPAALVTVAGYVRLEAAPANVMRAHEASGRGEALRKKTGPADSNEAHQVVMVVHGLVVRHALRGDMHLGRHLMAAAAAALPPSAHIYLSCLGARLVRFYEACGFEILGDDAGRLPTGFTSSVGAAEVADDPAPRDDCVTWLHRRTQEGSSMWADLPRLGYS